MKKNYLVLFMILLVNSLVFSQPSAPQNLKVSIEKWNGLKYIQLSWDQVSSGSVRYFVYKKEGTLSDTSSFLKLTWLEKNNYYKDKFVMRGKSYSYFVTAYSQGKESEPSDSVEISIADSLSTVLISGTVTDETTGQPLTSGKVTFIPLQGWNNKPAVIDSTGKYSSSILPGKYFIYFTSPKHVSEFYDNAYSIVNAASIEVKENTPLTLDAALKPAALSVKYALSGKVTDNSGNPMKAFISAYVLNRNCFKRDILHKMTDSLGNYSIQVRNGDSLVVFAEPKDKNYLPEFYNNKYELAEADRIYIDKDISGIDFVLDPKPVYNNSVSGKITDDSGHSVMANVTLYKLRDKSHPGIKQTLITDSLGNFIFTNIKPGAYIMRVLPEYGYLPAFYTKDGRQVYRWKDADSIEVTETSVLENLNVQVLSVPDSGNGIIEGKITDNDGDDVSGVIVNIINENSDLVSFATTDQNGVYVIGNIAPGNYALVTDKLDYSSSEQSNVVIDYSSSLKQSVPMTISALAATSVDGSASNITVYKLSQNYPNPFNPSTVINYQVAKAGLVTLKIYNIIGQEVATLVSGVKNSGSYNITFNADRLTSGVYFYTLTAGDVRLTKKMLLIK